MFIGLMIAYFLGVLWYHPKVFGSAWLEANHLKPEDCKKAPLIGMIINFLYHLTLGLLLMFIDSVMPLHGLLLMAFLLALASFLGIGMSVLFPRRQLHVLNVFF